MDEVTSQGQADSVEALVRSVQHKQCADLSIEVKEASAGTPRVYDSLSSFSNQNEGGFLVFGLNDNKGYAVTGVFDAEKLQEGITQQGEEMSPVVRPRFDSAVIDGKTVVSAYIEGRPMSQRPVYITASGVTKGSYSRVGDVDRLMEEAELDEIEAFQGGRRDDRSVSQQANKSMLDPQACADFLRRAQDKRPLLARQDTSEILDATGVTRNGRPTLAGLLVLADYPQQVYPNLCIIATAVAGTSMHTGSSAGPYIDSGRFSGSFSRMLENALAFVRKNSHIQTLMYDGGYISLPEYPENAVREILTNALIHRDYSPYSEETPIRLTLFSDRLECWNPGRIYGDHSLCDLSSDNPQIRNPTLVSLLEIEGLVEHRNSGMSLIREEAQKCGRRPVDFDSRLSSFTVRFYNSPADSQPQAAAVATRQEGPGPTVVLPITRDSVMAYLNAIHSRLLHLATPRERSKFATVLAACATPQTLESIAQQLGIHPYYAKKRYVSRLLEDGLLVPEAPTVSGGKKRRYLTRLQQD